MKLILKSLSLKNFKGAKDLTVDFGNNTIISGDNGVGKSTFYDAFCWLLFDKDGHGKTDFDLKIKVNKEVQHGLEYSVTGVFEIDGKEITFQKVLSEKWVKQRGTQEKTFQGNTTEYYINDIPQKKKEYDGKIAEIFRGDISQMLSDPTYFPVKMHWKERRDILFELLGGEINDSDIIDQNEELEPLRSELSEATVDELLTKYRTQKSKLTKDRDEIPVKIDTLTETIVDVDLSAIDVRIRVIKGGISNIDDLLQSGQAISQKRLELQKEIYDRKADLLRIENEIRSDVAAKIKPDNSEAERKAKTASLNIIKSSLATLEKTIAEYKSKIAKIIAERDNLRESMKAAIAEHFHIDEKDCICPTCKRELDNLDQVRADLEANWNEKQAEKKDKIKQQGIELNKEIESMTATLEDYYKRSESYAEEIATIESEIANIPEPEKVDAESEVKKALEESAEYKAVKEKILALEDELHGIKTDKEIEEKKAKKAELESEVEALTKEKAKAEQAQEIKKKIEELKQEEAKLNQKILDIEKMQYLCEVFTRTRGEIIEKGVNSKFQNVEFKLFDQQVNGGIAETCTVLVKGVEYHSANTAGKLNAGLDIINVLSDHYGYSVPVWMDNREGVFFIPEMKTQTISMVAAKGQPLKVEKE